MKPITLFSGTAGLNTVLDPERLVSSPEKLELAEAVNISIDDRGLPSLRRGGQSIFEAECHSLFCAGGDCFVIHERTEDAAIMRIVNTDVIEGVRSGLTKNLRMSWTQTNTDTFYSNGVENGYIRDGVSNAWPTSTYQGPAANRDFSAAPVGTHIAFKPGGLMLVAEGRTLWINHLPFDFGLFNKRSGFVQFASDILMICPVQSGVFVSDERQTWFLRGTNWHDFSQELAEDAPALEWSLAHDRVFLADIGIEEQGFGRVWASARGLCLGLDSGRVINLTNNKIKYPTAYRYGSCVVAGEMVINTVF